MEFENEKYMGEFLTHKNYKFHQTQDIDVVAQLL